MSQKKTPDEPGFGKMLQIQSNHKRKVNTNIYVTLTPKASVGQFILRYETLTIKEPFEKKII